MTAVYLETSALLRMLFQEAHGHEVRERLRVSDDVVASRLVQVEAQRALIRVQRDRPETRSRSRTSCLCPTITSTSFTGEPAFRFEGDPSRAEE